MTRFRLPILALLISLLWVCPPAVAQPPSPTPPAAPPVYPVLPGGPIECRPAPACCGPTKVCVPEPKNNTKVVYCSRCQEYCLPGCGSLLDLCRKKGSCDCKDGNCGPVRTRHVLVKKKVPDCDTITCVVKDLSCETPCLEPSAVPLAMPTPAPAPAPIPVAPAPATPFPRRVEPGSR